MGLRAQTSSTSLTTRFYTAFNSSFIQDRAKATQRQQCKGTGYKRHLGMQEHLVLNSGIQTVFAGILWNSNKTASLQHVIMEDHIKTNIHHYCVKVLST